MRGCTPKKYLRAGAEIVDLLNRMDGRGVVKNDATLSWADMQAHRREYTDPIPVNNQKMYANAGVAFFAGSAAFQGEDSVAVTLTSGEVTVLRFKQCVIATGARPMDLPFGGAELVQSSDDFLEMDSLPRSMLFIGGGFISMEYAHIAARFGVQVQVVQRAPLPLKTFDPDLVKQLVEIGEAHAGVSVLNHCEVVGVTQNSDGTLACRVRDRQNGEEETLAADAIFNGAGRVPNVKRMHTLLLRIVHSLSFANKAVRFSSLPAGVAGLGTNKWTRNSLGAS